MSNASILGMPTPWVALAGLTVFALLAFGLRTLLHYRRTGRSGWVGLSGAIGSAEWTGGVLFVVALIASAAGPLVQAAGLVSPAPALDVPAARALGVALMLLGIVGTLWAQLAMGESWRIGVDDAARTTLVVAVGPFRLIRNPIFAAMLVSMVGLALLVPNVVALAALATLFLALEIQVRRVEEPYLTRTHGDDYLRYAAGTGRFVPGLGRLRGAAPGGRRGATA